MKNDDLDGVSVTVDLSDIYVKDIPSLTTNDLQTLSLNDIDTFDLSNLAPPTFDYGSYTYPISGGGSGGYINTSASTSIYTSHSPTITLSPNTYANTAWATAPLTVNGTNGISVKGDAEIEGNLKVKGVDLGEMLSKIQDQLAIYQPAPELEEKWEELRELARKYKELVANIKEKEQIWDILKK